MSATLYPVHVLTKDIRLHHKGHICNVDNWYTSIPMLVYLHAIGTHCVGTVKSKLKGLPKEEMMIKEVICFCHLRKCKVIYKCNLLDGKIKTSECSYVISNIA